MESTMASLRNTLKATFVAIEKTLDVIPELTGTVVDVVHVANLSAKEFTDNYKADRDIRDKERSNEKEERVNNVTEERIRILEKRAELLESIPTAEEITKINEGFDNQIQALFGNKNK